MAQQQQQQPDDTDLTGQIGPIEVNWPKAAGYYSGIGLAAFYGLIEPPLAIFIAAVPLFKMLSQPGAPLSVRFVSEVLDGASKPVGGDGEAAVKLANRDNAGGLLGRLSGGIGSIWTDAQEVARSNGARSR